MSDLQSSDDEFDELFSFSATNAVTTTTTQESSSSSSIVRSSSSPFHLDLSEKEPAFTEDDNPSTIPSSRITDEGVPPVFTSASTSAQTSESGSSSYYKVSPILTANATRPFSDHGDNDDDNNDLKLDMEQDESLDDFDLDAVNFNVVGNVKQREEEEDDFHDLDADTRELLEFLDEPSKTTVAEAKAHASLDILEKDLEDSDDDDDDDDGAIMDFVDIEEKRTNSSSSRKSSSSDQKDEDHPDGKKDRLGKDVKNVSAMSTPHVTTATVAETNVSTVTESKTSTGTLVEEHVHSTNHTESRKTDMEPVAPTETLTPTITTTTITMTSLDQPSPPPPTMSPSSLQKNSYPNHLLPSSPPIPSKKGETSTASTSNPYQANSILASMDDESIDSGLEDTNVPKITTKNEQESNQKDHDLSGNLIANVQVIEKEVVFETFSEAIRSRDSPVKTIQSMLCPHPMDVARVNDEDRAHLWSKMICSRTLSDVEMSSLADSFVTWDESFDMRAFEEGDLCYGFLEDFINQLLDEVDVLSKRIVPCGGGGGGGGGDSSSDEEMSLVVVKRNLCSILLFYYQSNFIPDRQQQQGQYKTDESIETGGLDDSLVLEEDVTENVRMEFESESKDQEDVALEKEEKAQPPKEKRHAVEWNSLIGPVACTLLASGATTAAASVMLSRIIPTYMPLVPLTKQERVEAVKSIHMKLHHLVCYHFPLLSLHLDRNIPGWYWPQSAVDSKDELSDFESGNVTEKSRHLEAQGIIPMTWFSSLLAGEGRDLMMDKSRLLALWDVLLSTRDQSLKFFLALSVLERNSEKLLMLKGRQLIDELVAVLSLKNPEQVESFVTVPADGKDKLDHEQEYVRMWINHARTLRQNTPVTVVEYLNKSEDDAVNYILHQRSKIAMETVAARLEAEAEAHRRAMEEESAKKVEERLRKYYRDRLEKYYEKHCPEKISAIDQILDIYKDRYQVLDKKLHAKYGKGFLPLISVFSPKVTSQTGKMISTVNQGIEIKKKNIIAARAEERAKLYAEQMEGTKQKAQVAIPVSASEIMPIVCGGKKMEKVNRMMTRDTLKYYLVDSRPEASMKAQGSFPTAARLSPEDLMDPERLQQKIEMFESLRGTVHIVIMGEGFSAFPSLYGHPLDINEQKLLENDESRTSMCALFFIKRGFPFISVLDGGFAAAHAWLARELKDELSLSEILIDYDVESSLFADLERSYQEQEEFKSAPARRKTMLAMQKLIDNSMIRLTAAEAQIEEFTDRFMTARKEVKDNGTKELTEDDNNANNDAVFESSTESVENEKKSESISLKSTFAGFRNKASHKNNDGVTKDQKTFDLGKLSFGRERSHGKEPIGSDTKTSQLNIFKKHSKNEDYDLEKKIDESLAPPPENQVEEGKLKSNIFQRMKFGSNNNASEKTNIKDAFAKIKFTKFNSTRPTIPVEDDDADALRQEESVLFDDN